MTYERTVAAAVAETASKFKLAEALALDIPPRTAGRIGAAEDMESIRLHLQAAREAIVAVGCEDKSVETLEKYRKTALWVSESGPQGPNFRWLSNFSFTAHRRAMEAGIPYDDFAANPRTGKQVAIEAGYSFYKPETAIRSMTPEQRVEAAASLLTDPEIADTVIAQPEARRAVYEAVNRRQQQAATRRERIEQADPVARELQGLNSFVEMHSLLRRFVGDFTELYPKLVRLPEANPLANREFLALWLEHSQECLDQLRAYLDTGTTDLDAFLDSVLKGA